VSFSREHQQLQEALLAELRHRRPEGMSDEDLKWLSYSLADASLGVLISAVMRARSRRRGLAAWFRRSG